MSDRQVRRTRTFRWLRLQVEGLLAVPPAFLVVGGRVVHVQQTRLGLQLDPPDLTPPAPPAAAPSEE